jgi:hypothetical protein
MDHHLRPSLLFLPAVPCALSPFRLEAVRVDLLQPPDIAAGDAALSPGSCSGPPGQRDLIHSPEWPLGILTGIPKTAATVHLFRLLA